MDPSDWDPDPSAGECFTAADDKAELEQHISPRWTVETFDVWGPTKTNHGGTVDWKVTLSHEAGVVVELVPASTFPDRAQGRTVYNSHRLYRKDPGGTRELVADEREMLNSDHPGDVFATVVQAAQEFSSRYQLWHGKPREENESPEVEG
ncbi:hypothetical protein [Saliphagus sp. LR7]|uniref:hypothetical protein n=1 Tax=Saliphagus sp. LR7 TaxID=2282654 RepID=UPI000DF7DAC7|nr:hypothetical protein [Saliphagus sp. LR7]